MKNEYIKIYLGCGEHKSVNATVAEHNPLKQGLKQLVEVGLNVKTC